MKVKLNELMTIERILLEIDSNHKFDLDFNDAYTLYEYLKMVGKITSYAFLIQNEFHNKYNDVDKLKEYHDRINNELIEFNNLNEVINFIDILVEKINDEELKSLVSEIKFWY